MELRDLSEFGWIERIRRAAERDGVPRHVVVGIGDDGAVLRPRAGEDLVVSTDALVEDAHFRWKTDTERAIGARAVAAGLSDLAAMGARPLGVVVAFAGPPGLPVARLDGVVRGLLSVCRDAEAPLVGGNVARARKTSLTVTALGAVGRGRALRRDRARRGDRILVTGRLGESALARARAEAGGARVRHVPTPRIAAGRALARLGSAGACIDVSDGLVADLGHVLEASGVGARLASAAFPRRRGFEAACRRLGTDPIATLLGGEDYELLFTVRANAPDATGLARRLGVPIAEIGNVTASGLQLDGRRIDPARGWKHF